MKSWGLETGQHSSGLQLKMLFFGFGSHWWSSLDARRSTPRPWVHRPRASLHQSTAKTEGVFFLFSLNMHMRTWWTCADGWIPTKRNRSELHSNLVLERALEDIGLMSFRPVLKIFHVRFRFIKQTKTSKEEWRRREKITDATSSPTNWPFFNGVTRPWTWKREGGCVTAHWTLEIHSQGERREGIHFYFFRLDRWNGPLFFSIVFQIYFSLFLSDARVIRLTWVCTEPLASLTMLAIVYI